MDVNSIRARAEEYRAELELDRYELDRGLRQESRAREIRASYGDLFVSETRDIVAKAEAESKAAGSTEERQLNTLRAGLTRAFVERELAPIDDSIRRHGRVVLVELDDGGKRPLRDVRLLLAETPDAEERGRLEDARLQAARDLTPLMAEKIGIEQGIARNLGATDLVQLWQQLYGCDPEDVAKLAGEVLEKTADLYRDVMGWTVKKRLGVELADARRCDIPFVFAARYTDYEDAFSVSEVVAATREWLSNMRIDLTANGRIKLEVEHPDGPSRAFLGAIRIPKDIRFAVELREGQRDWFAFLTALGRALFLGHVDPEEPFEHRALGDGSIDLAYATLFRHLLLDREFLKKALGFQRPKDYVILGHLERLYDLRLCAGRLLYEIELRRAGSVEGMEECFEMLMRSATGLNYPRELYLHDVRNGLHSLTQLRARLFEALFSSHLVHYFDEDWWRNPRCGPFLKKQWATGRKLRVEESAKEIGYDGLTVKPLVKLFTKML
ncbi:MAG: hypothetical protein ACAI25_20890 [Planctomycetota bacterium]